MGDNELGEFLRARREAVTPAQVGLVDGPRRRTPGLRRSELATLAGVSVDYLVRLEQGRDRHPSAQVLGALSQALQLSSDERFLLLRIAKAAGGAAALCPAGVEPPSLSLRPTVQALLDQLEPCPAYVRNRLGDLLAFTGGYARLAGPVGLLDATPPNLARFVFADPRARDAFPEWDTVAGAVLAELRAQAAHGDAHAGALADELHVTAGAEFSRRFAGPLSVAPHRGVDLFAHPKVGLLRLAYEGLDLPGDDQRLVVYLPADGATSRALDRLAGRHPGSLRAVAS